ncbi:Oligopeptide transporter 7 [Anopheles sinensis]|uniref:Oligopeptide transporter 7 n=1 Tax=Anopheles sinensis TaxID=74873 RepID=A0A084VPM1_ANOSI|nr:Oligopeptide transporter 7 [Anopheles sinensis]
MNNFRQLVENFGPRNRSFDARWKTRCGTQTQARRPEDSAGKMLQLLHSAAVLQSRRKNSAAVKKKASKKQKPRWTMRNKENQYRTGHSRAMI